jgi:dihydroorotase
VNASRVTVEKAEWEVPREYPFGAETVVPLRAGEKLRWRFAG